MDIHTDKAELLANLNIIFIAILPEENVPELCLTAGSRSVRGSHRGGRKTPDPLLALLNKTK